MAKTKVLIILEATLGGTRKHIFDIIESIGDSRYEIGFIYDISRADNQFLDKFKELKNFISFSENLSMSMRFGKIFYAFSSLLKLIRIYKSFNPEIIHFHGAYAGFYGRIALLFTDKKFKAIYTPHGGSFHKMKNRTGLLFIFIENLLSLVCNNYIAVSKNERDVIDKYILTKKSIFQIPNAINSITINNSNSPKYELVDTLATQYKNNFKVIYPALFLPAKGHLRFLMHLKNTHLNDDIIIFFLGDGPLFKEVSSIIQGDSYLRSKTVLLGFKPNSIDYILYSDLVILPSNFESFGYVILEAFLCKKPVIATNVGGLSELIDDELDGFLIPQNNFNLLFDKINYLKNNKEIADMMGKRGYEKIQEQYSLDKFKKDISNVYSSL